MNKQIEAMRKLGMTEEEIKQVLADDKRIDKGEKLFELTAEQTKASREARQADRKPTVYKLDNEKGKRSKKADTQKQLLIEVLTQSLKDHTSAVDLNIINSEREFEFMFNGKKYRVTLSAPRS